MKKNLIIADTKVSAGSRKRIELTIPSLYNHAPMTLPVHVIRGAKTGPRLFVTAALHGDEINGIEVIRRLLKLPFLKELRGSLITVPVVNLHGFLTHSRYLPDRRDLNRCFPGSSEGSLAGRIANTITTEIIANCTHGIDLHTAAIHRNNLPQIRANLDQSEAARLAENFDLPVIINSKVIKGSLRHAAQELGVPVLLYEGGEALRFDEFAIQSALKGILGVMRELKMLPAKYSTKDNDLQTHIASSTSWLRAPASGLLRKFFTLGDRVKQGQVIGIIDDLTTGKTFEVQSNSNGIIIGSTEIPTVAEGEALFHIARFRASKTVADQINLFKNKYALEQGNSVNEANERLIV